MLYEKASWEWEDKDYRWVGQVRLGAWLDAFCLVHQAANPEQGFYATQNILADPLDEVIKYFDIEKQIYM